MSISGKLLSRVHQEKAAEAQSMWGLKKLARARGQARRVRLDSGLSTKVSWGIHVRNYNSEKLKNIHMKVQRIIKQIL